MQDSLKILESVNQFYTQSFNQLVMITVAVLAFAGVMMPVLTSLYQQRLFKLEHDDIKKQINAELQEELKLEMKKLEDRYEKKEIEHQKKIEELHSKIDLEIAGALAGSLHIQGNISLRNNNHFNAFHDFTRAGTGYIKANKEVNLRRVIHIIVKLCLPHLTGAQITSDDEHAEEYRVFITALESINQNSRYQDDLKRIKLEYRRAVERIAISKSA
ncbi:hypothetical protein [Moritella sp. 28]|uniref:hypothetical protein n=1 Tax=Moritella sp. 28 TaxID=2746232 RepID=UPI001BAADF8B|nr:hypothetical protein [Moritella sp. 28]QUM86325.1 hypothetical protein HWV02_18340 [Moritella sp. 28]